MTDIEFINLCKTSLTMRQVCIKLKIPFSTFKRKAQKLNCYIPNRGAAGTNKPKKEGSGKPYLADILNGYYPDYKTKYLKWRLFENHIFEDKCSICGWNKKYPGSKYSMCELHHKDGNTHNHKKENLQILCPNCHSLTSTFRARKRAPMMKG